MSELDFGWFAENGDLPLQIIGADGRIERANKAQLELVGCSAADYVGRHISEFHADRAVADDILARLSRAQKLKGYAARLRRRDGSLRHVRITSGGRIEHGPSASTLCVTADVTDEAGCDSHPERYWRAALDALPAAVYTTDRDGRITYFNKAAVEFSGRTPDVGSDEWCVTWRMFDLDGAPLPHNQCPMAIALKERRPVRGVEAIAERPDGTRLRFEPYPTPLYDEDGLFIGGVNLLIDVTEQRNAEADAARLAAIVRSANDAIVSKTLQGIVTSWNGAATRMFGYEADEMIGQSILRIIPDELHDEEDTILAKLRRGERIEHFETVRVAKDGSRLDISLSVSPVRDRTGRVIGAAKVARDITQRKRAEAVQQLLLGELNHRVKNTLATVQSIASQTLRRAGSPGEFVPSFLGRIQSLASAHDLLTQSNWQGVELIKLVETQLLADGPADERISMSGPNVTLPPQSALHLALILHELGTNARKHGALRVSNGRVSVSWSVRSRPPDALHLQWREAGGPPVHAAPRRAGFGTMLIERSVRAIEGGEAQMRINADGISWSILLPAEVQTEPQAAVPAGSAGPRRIVSEGAARTGSGKRVLVVEDEPLLAMDIEAMLKDGGYNVIGPANSMDQAMRLVVRNDFDAALLDANLGGRTVDDLAAALTRKSIPFAFVTGYSRESLPRAFASAPVLAKPVDEAGLLNVVKRMLSISAGVVPMRRDDRA